jgi:DNA gyrase subunit B
MHIQTHRDGNLYEIAFKDGKLHQPLTMLGPSSGRGTKMRFLPELSLFSATSIDVDALSAQIREAAQKYEYVTVTITRE